MNLWLAKNDTSKSRFWTAQQSLKHLLGPSIKNLVCFRYYRPIFMPFYRPVIGCCPSVIGKNNGKNNLANIHSYELKFCTVISTTKAANLHQWRVTCIALLSMTKLVIKIQSWIKTSLIYIAVLIINVMSSILHVQQPSRNI